MLKDLDGHFAFSCVSLMGVNFSAVSAINSVACWFVGFALGHAEGVQDTEAALSSALASLLPVDCVDIRIDYLISVLISLKY